MNHHMRNTLSATLLILVIVVGAGCTVGRNNQADQADFEKVKPTHLPPTGLAAESSRLSGVSSSAATYGSPTPIRESNISGNDIQGSSYERDTDRNSDSGRGGCSGGGCDSCSK